MPIDDSTDIDPQCQGGCARSPEAGRHGAVAAGKRIVAFLHSIDRAVWCATSVFAFTYSSVSISAHVVNLHSHLSFQTRFTAPLFARRCRFPPPTKSSFIRNITGRTPEQGRRPTLARARSDHRSFGRVGLQGGIAPRSLHSARARVAAGADAPRGRQSPAPVRPHILSGLGAG